MRKQFESRGKQLSYIEFGDCGYPIIALHGHFGCATMFGRLAKELNPSYRIVALDQQGHGFSDHEEEYSREGYIQDIANFMNEIKIEQAILLGHSLGGVNAYQFAASYPEKVAGIIIEDIGTMIQDDLGFIKNWPVSFLTIRDAIEFLIGEDIDNYIYFLESLTQTADGWRFQFDRTGLIKSQKKLNGDWTQDWEKVQCDIMLLHGEHSDVLSTEQANEISQRKNVELIHFYESGHTIRDVEFLKYKDCILRFLEHRHFIEGI